MSKDASSQAVEAKDRYYIRAGSSLADDRTLVMKDGETFGLFDHYGDIHPYGLGEQGVFHEGTRHLSAFGLQLNGRRPLFLGSAVSPDNDTLTVDLSNPDLTSDSGVVVPRGTIHIHRNRLLWGGTCYERIRLENFGLLIVPLAVSLSFDADFVDIFEVRGTTRPRRGQFQPPQHPSPGRLILSYRGLDDVLRHTDITVSANCPAAFEGSRVTLRMMLLPRAGTEITLQLRCRAGAIGPVPTPYAEALSERARRLDELVKEECQLSTPSSAVNLSLNRCRADLHLMLTPTPYGLYPYGGVPWFSTPFGRGGLITALETLWVNPSIARGVLTFLAATQATASDAASEADPGKILHEMRRGEMAALDEVPFRRYYGSVDATPLFVMLAGAYYRRTGDLGLIERLWSNIEAALAWIEDYGDLDRDGFVEYAQRGNRGLPHHGWKDALDGISHSDGALAETPIALCEVQGYVFAAKHAAALMAVARGDHIRAATLRQEARTLQDAFDREFWLPDEGTYALALDRDKAPCRVRTSNAGHCLFTGIAYDSRAAALTATLMAESSFSGWGIRTLDAREERYNPMSYHNGSVWPHDTALVAAGLARYGFRHEAAQILEGLINLSHEVHLQRLPELICGFPRNAGDAPTGYPVACAPQSGAAGSLYMALEACLGLHIDAVSRTLTFEHAALPPSISQLRLSGLTIGSAVVDLTLEHVNDHVSVKVDQRRGAVDIVVRK